MRATLRPRIKICCIRSVSEAQVAIEHGASALGLVSSMPSGPGTISDDLISEIAAIVPPGVASVLLTCEDRLEGLIEQQQRTRVNTLQLVDSVPPGTHAALRQALPGISIVQVVHVNGLQALPEAAAIAPQVHAILLDSGNPQLAVKELGGTGRVHDWDVSRKIRENIPVPLFLAGGLRAENVGEAIHQVRPYGLDICSGVRTEGNLDAMKLVSFFKAIETAVAAEC